MTWGQYNEKIMQVKAFVTVSDTLQGAPTNDWAMNLVRQVNSHLNEVKIGYGGGVSDAVEGAIPAPTCLEDVFPAADVAGLAMIAYKESVKDLTFFQDSDVLSKYFLPTTNAWDVFKPLDHL